VRVRLSAITFVFVLFACLAACALVADLGDRTLADTGTSVDGGAPSDAGRNNVADSGPDTGRDPGRRGFPARLRS
jgi:hypothetical protein